MIASRVVAAVVTLAVAAMTARAAPQLTSDRLLRFQRTHLGRALGDPFTSMWKGRMEYDVVTKDVAREIGPRAAEDLEHVVQLMPRIAYESGEVEQRAMIAWSNALNDELVASHTPALVSADAQDMSGVTTFFVERREKVSVRDFDLEVAWAYPLGGAHDRAVTWSAARRQAVVSIRAAEQDVLELAEAVASGRRLYDLDARAHERVVRELLDASGVSARDLVAAKESRAALERVRPLTMLVAESGMTTFVLTYLEASRGGWHDAHAVLAAELHALASPLRAPAYTLARLVRAHRNEFGLETNIWGESITALRAELGHKDDAELFRLPPNAIQEAAGRAYARRFGDLAPMRRDPLP